MGLAAQLQEAMAAPLGESQEIFNPANYGFRWTKDWYEFDSKEAHKKAMQARDARAKELKKEGRRFKKFTLRNQLITRGGIGTPHPEITVLVTGYGLNY